MRILSAFLLTLPLTFPFTLAAIGAPVTFNQDIAPIIYRNCSSCHRPGEAAPFALLSYGNVARA